MRILLERVGPRHFEGDIEVSNETNHGGAVRIAINGEPIELTTHDLGEFRRALDAAEGITE